MRGVVPAEAMHALEERLRPVTPLVSFDRFGRLRCIAPPQDAACREHPGEGSRGVGAAREAEDVYLVSGRVVEDQEAIRVAEVLDHPAPKYAAGELVEPVAGPDAFIVVDGLRDAGARDG